MKGWQELICGPANVVIFNDLWWPRITPCTHVDYIKSELSVDKASLKVAWSGSHGDPFSILTLLIISPERLKRESPIFTGMWLHYDRVFAIVNPSVCLLSVMLVHPTHGIKAFGIISSPLCTWPSSDPCAKFYRDRPRETPSSGALNATGVGK